MEDEASVPKLSSSDAVSVVILPLTPTHMIMFIGATREGAIFSSANPILALETPIISYQIYPPSPFNSVDLRESLQGLEIILLGVIF